MLFLSCCLLGTIIAAYTMHRNRSPDDVRFDLLTAEEQIDKISAAKDALHECEALQTACESSCMEYQPAITISWTDTEDHEVTIFLCGDFSADCLCKLAMREAQETRGQIAAMVMQCNHELNGV